MREPGQQVMSMVMKCNTILVMQSHAPAGPVTCSALQAKPKFFLGPIWALGREGTNKHFFLGPIWSLGREGTNKH
jgi:hypothetical protein